MIIYIVYIVHYLDSLISSLIEDTASSIHTYISYIPLIVL